MRFGFGALPPATGGITADDLVALFSPAGAATQGQPAFQPADDQMGFLARRRLLREAEDGAAQAGLLSGSAMAPPMSFGPLPGAPAQEPAPLEMRGIRPDTQPAQPEMNVPSPPARPSAADLAFDTGPASSPATLRVQPSNSADRGPARNITPRADMPVAGAAPASGQAPSPPLSFGPLPPPRPAEFGAPATATATAQADMPVANAVPIQGQAPASGGFGEALSGFRDRGGFDFLGALGTALLSAPTWAGGIANGMQGYEKSQVTKAATDLARAEYGLKARKLGQADAGLNVTRNQLIAKGNAPADVDTAIAASQAGHNDPLNNLLNRVFPKVAEAPAGFTLNPDGSMRRIVGGPQDPAVKREDAQATAEGSNAGKPAEPFNLTAGQTRYNADGTPLISAAAAPSDTFDRETKLRGEFTKQLGSFQDVHDGFGRVIASTEQRQVNPNAKSPAADIGLIFGFMKMLDPGSVVREGEYATAQNAASVPERVRNAYNKAMSGEFLTPEQRQGFIEQAEGLYGQARTGAEGVAERYRGIASQYGVDPGRSVYLPNPLKAPKVGESRTRLPEAGTPLDIGGTRDAGSGITIKRVR